VKMGDLEQKEAIALIEEGYSPIPLVALDKKPKKGFKFSKMVVDTEEKVKRTVWVNDDGNEVRILWAGVGIHPGRSNVWVMDVDGEEGFAELKELTNKYGELPETRTVKSGRIDGGMHYHWDATGLFVHSGKLAQHEHIDIKGNVGNTIAVVPPTMHKSGNRYEYLNRCKPVAAPDWLVKLVSEKTPKPSRETAGYTPGTGSLITDDYGLTCVEIGAPSNAHQTDQGLQGMHPFHGSTTGKDVSNNFSVNVGKNTWYCFAHQSGGGALELYAIRRGIIKCEDAKPGCLDGKIPEIIQALKSDGYRSRVRKEEINTARRLLENAGVKL